MTREQLYSSIYVTGRAALALWFLLAAVAAAACLALPALAPWLLRADPVRRPSPARAALLAAAAVAALALVALDLRAADFFVHDEAIGFFTVADVCARGVRCPLVGQPMLYGIHLGPAFYQVLSLVQLAGDPRTGFFVLLRVQLAAAAVLLALASRVALGRGPWGVVAGASLYVSATFGPQLVLLEHATLAVLPGAGFVYAALSFARRRRARDFVVAALCLAAAVQLHGILFPLAPALALLGLGGRAPRRAWAGAALGVAGLFLPWLIFEARTGAHDLTHTFGFAGALGLTGGARVDWRPWFDVDLWPLAALGLLGAAVVALRPAAPSEERRGAAGVLLLGVTALGTFWLGRAGWSARYSLLLHLALGPALAAGPWALWRAASAARQRLAAGPWRRWAAAPLVPAAVAVAWLVHPLARRAQERVHHQWRSLGALSYAQQRRVGARLSARGFGPVALDRDLHGPGWDRQYGPGWLFDPHAARGVGRGPARHALLGRSCATPGGAFAAIRGGPGDLAVALYTPRLAVASAALDLADGTSFRGPIALPLFARPTGYLFVDPVESLDMLGRAHPDFALAPETRRLLAVWRRPAPGTLRLFAALGRGDDARRVVVAHDARLPVVVRAGGVELPAVARAWSSRGDVAHDSFRVGPPGDDVAFDVAVARPDGALPVDLELYEEPAARCP